MSGVAILFSIVMVTGALARIESVNDESITARLTNAEQFLHGLRKGPKGFPGARGPPGFHAKTRSPALSLLRDLIRAIELRRYAIKTRTEEEENRLQYLQRKINDFNSILTEYDGEPGRPGPKGEPGEPGIPGMKGDNGEAGYPGIGGAPGIPGEHGLPGLPGGVGITGATGATGQFGQTGAIGDPGPSGRVARSVSGQDPSLTARHLAFTARHLVSHRQKREQSLDERLGRLERDIQRLDINKLKGEKGERGEVGLPGPDITTRSSIVSYINAYAHETRRKVTHAQARLRQLQANTESFIRDVRNMNNVSPMFNIAAVPPVSLQTDGEIWKEIKFVPGQTLELSCAAAGLPAPECVWLHGAGADERIVTNTVSEGPGQSSLVFEDVRRSDAGQYRCYAHNDHGTANVTNIFLAETFLEASVSGERRTLRPMIGEPLIVPCFQSSAYPQPNITWIRVIGDTEVPLELDQRVTIDYNGKLYFTYVLADDAGVYACAQQNEAVGVRIVGGHTEVIPTNITGPIPEARLMWNSATYMSVREGDTWRAKCIFSGGFYSEPGLPVTRWRKVYGILPRTARIESFGQEVVVDHVTLDDAGDYECVFEDTELQIPLRRSLTLDVGTPPRWITRPNSVNVAEGEEASFQCQAESIPQSTKIWQKDTKPIRRLPGVGSRITVTADVLTFSNVTQGDMGTVQCIVENRFGSMASNVYLNVIDAGIRGAPGIPGLPGEKGDRGFDGIPGIPGQKGLPGSPGLDGLPGEPGNPGFPGIYGRKGATGHTGPEGPQGSKGAIGPPGSLSIQKRDIGEEDERLLYRLQEVEEMLSTYQQADLRGAVGRRGPRGPQGKPLSTNGRIYMRLRSELLELLAASDVTGSLLNATLPLLEQASRAVAEKEALMNLILQGGLRHGPPGEDGYTGAKGDPGLSGLTGIQGPKGEDGFPGRPGLPGERGGPGIPGREGQTGATGATGIPGRTGAKGERGPPV